MASSPAARWGTSKQTSDGELELCSPVIDWSVVRLGRSVAAQGRCSRGGSDGGEGRGDAQQCVAPGASMLPREGARQVTVRGGSAEGQARRWRSGADAEAQAPASRQLG
jgi:hypothetical protein